MQRAGNKHAHGTHQWRQWRKPKLLQLLDQIKKARHRIPNPVRLKDLKVCRLGTHHPPSRRVPAHPEQRSDAYRLAKR